MSQIVKILIVDDHNLIRDGIRFLLESQQEMLVQLDEAKTAERAVELCTSLHYDVVFMDIRLPGKDGFWACEEMLHINRNANIIITSMLVNWAYVDRAKKMGVGGYLLKNTGKIELLKAISSVLEGGQYYCSEAAALLLQQQAAPGVEVGTDLTLTIRELQILQLIADEYTNDEISEKLSISKRTIDTHRQNMMQKTGCKRTVGLVKYGLVHKLIK